MSAVLADARPSLFSYLRQTGTDAARPEGVPVGRTRGGQVIVLLVVAGLMAPLVLGLVLTGRSTRRVVQRSVRESVRRLVDEIELWR